MLSLSDLLGIPQSTDKTEGPACIITFLGITLDTLQMELCLLDKKIQRLFEEWSFKRWCRKRDNDAYPHQLKIRIHSNLRCLWVMGLQCLLR